MTLGERIQKYRKMKGLSQEELGKLPHISRQTISKWEYKVVRLWLMFLASL